MATKVIATLFVFESKSTPGKTYQTLQYTDGSTSCECPAWVFKKKSAGGERTCVHVRDVQAGLGNRHAMRVVEYAKKGIRTVQRSMEQGMLEPQPAVGRAFDFSDV